MSKEERLKKAIEYCSTCVKFNGSQCIALNQLFHLWNDPDTECWAREENAFRYLEQLQQAASYLRSRSYRGLDYSMSFKDEIRRVEKLAQEQVEKGLEDWREVYYEEVHRPGIKKGGGGEKADRTNKTFGPQQMKDNRFTHRKRNPRKYSDWYEWP